MDRHDLYELCVQSPRHVVELLRGIHGGDPVALAEDFCGTAAVSREWALGPGRRAVAADIDEATLRRGAAGAPGGVRFVRADVIASRAPGGADVIFVGNFSIGEVHDRPALVGYLRRAHARLHPRGVFVCDTYGGESAYRIGAVTRTHAAADGSIVHYTWEHRRADAATAMVENAIHFRVVRAGEVVLELPEAFTYRWRLWTIAELREAMTEAGFSGTSVHASLDEHGTETSRGVSAEGLPENYIVCVAARRS